MKRNRLPKRIVAIALALSLAIPVIGAQEAEAAKKASISSYYKKMELSYNKSIDSRKCSSSVTSLEDAIENLNAKATYSIKIKNKKIAKPIANTGQYTDDTTKTLICAAGPGTTTGVVYEKLNKKKTKIGSIKIRVKTGKLGDMIYSTAADMINKYIPYTVYLSPYMNVTTFDLKAAIDSFLCTKSNGIYFKKSDYTTSFKANYDVEEEGVVLPEADQPIALSSAGLITAKKPGSAQIDISVKFKDNSKFSWTANAEVLESSIQKEGKYSLDNIRDYIVGIDTKVPIVSDGVSGEAVQIAFDNAATTPAFKPVENEVHEKLEMYGSIGRGFSEKSNYSTDLYNNTRNRVLDFLGADHTYYTCFYVNSTTDGLNKLASALITSKKDLVLATRIEHHANDLSWRERCKVIYAEVDKNGRVKYDDLEKMLKKNKVKIVTITAASNVTGYVTDVHRVAKMAHKYGAVIVVDGAQIVAHRSFSMIGDPKDPSDDIDFFAFSAHKMYSPYGGGAVVGKSELLYQHMPTFYGGGTVEIVADNWVKFKENDVAVYEAGSPNYPGVVGLGKAIDVLSDVGFDAISAHEKALNRRLIDGLKAIDKNIILYGDTTNIDDRVGVVTFNFKDINTQLLAEALSEIGAVATRRGQFCAHPYVWRLMGIPDSELESFEGCASSKTPGMIRVSFGIYNTEEEVDQFLKILPKAMKAAKEKGKLYDNVPEY